MTLYIVFFKDEIIATERYESEAQDVVYKNQYRPERRPYAPDYRIVKYEEAEEIEVRPQ